MKSVIRIEYSCAALCAAFVLLLAPTAHGAQLTVVDGSGAPGHSVAVSIELSGDTRHRAASADLDIAFPSALVAIATPIKVSCHIAQRLESTHQIGGRIARPGLLRLALFARGLQIRPLGNGTLATCQFQIAAGAHADSAQLVPQYVGLGNSRGRLLPVDGIAGEIAISAGAVLTHPRFEAATMTAAPASCAADCNGDGVVTVPELISSINVALGRAPLSACPASDGNGDSAVLIDDLVNGIGGAVGGCR